MANTKLVGILNVTPDSFSDGDESFVPEHALARAEHLIAQGASVVDVGAESTRPGAIALSAEEEWQRLNPVWEALASLCRDADVQLSLDTRHAFTAACALEIGCDWVNDVSGFGDEAMVEAVRPYQCKLVVMHALSIPADAKDVLPESCDPIAEVKRFFAQRCEMLQGAGIARDRIILDPGIGFGKTTEQSLALLWHVEALKAQGYPLLIGHSRKSFFKPFCDDWQAQRDGMTKLVSHYLCEKEVAYLRVHDVAGHRELYA